MARITKILYIVDSYSSPYAGTEGQLFKLISGLDRSKFEPHLLVFNPSEFISNNGFPCSVTLLGYSKLSSLKTWACLFQVLKKKKREGFVLAHIFFNDPSVIAPPLLKVLGFKTIISRRDMGYWYTPAYIALLRLNARLIDLAVVNSEAVKTVTCSKERVSPDKVTVIYNGYDDLEVSDCSNKAAALIEESAPFERGAKESITLGIVANIRPIKRMQDAIKSLAELVSLGVNLRLVIVGGGDPTELKRLAQTLGVEHRVAFVGSQRDTSSFIQNFDICLLCSESEGFSNSIIEYMQHGKPVVCSAVGGNPEVIINGQDGYLYPMGEVESLTVHLKKLCQDKALRQQIGAKAKDKVAGLYSEGNMLLKHEAAYRELLD